MSGRNTFSQSGDDGSVMHGEFMAFVMDDESLLTLRIWTTKQGYPPATVQLAGPDLFAQMLGASAPPKLAVIDIDGLDNPAATMARLTSLCGAECRMIVIGSANDVTLYRQILGAGALDYLVKPLTDALLNQAMAAALRGGSLSKPGAKECRIIVMIGARGGVGASTIAINVGWLMAHEMNLTGALLDLDLQFGTSSLALDLEPGHGLRDIVNSPHRVDSLMIASSMVAESERFSVLAAEEAVDEFAPIDSSAITALLKEMRNNLDFIIVDLPRHELPGQKRLLTAAHEIVVITELSLAGIRDALRIKTALKTLDCTGTISMVVSRVGSSRPGQLDQPAFEKGAQSKVDCVVPEDPKTIAGCANIGKALGAVAKTAQITKTLSTLAKKLSGQTEDDSKTPKKGGGLWQKLSGSDKAPDKKSSAPANQKGGA